jgi:transcriptional regulator with XRE-family HTH domain
MMISWAILQEARHRAGLTQRELAERAGTSQSAIARIERGRQIPSLETLQRILRACDLDLELRIVPHDTHDDTLIDWMLAMTPEQRLRNIEELSRFVAEARRSTTTA